MVLKAKLLHLPKLCMYPREANLKPEIFMFPVPQPPYMYMYMYLLWSVDVCVFKIYTAYIIIIIYVDFAEFLSLKDFDYLSVIKVKRILI